jgi:hypothetical protein
MKPQYLFAFVILLAASFTHAQAYGVNCDTQPMSSQGCKSYDDMIMSRDKELIEFIDNESDMYVCFRPNVDVFFLLGFKKPSESRFKTGNTGYPEATGQGLYFRYSDGVLDDSKIVNGVWRRFTPKDGPVFFATPASDTHASINDSELSVAYTFTNLSHKTTEYTVTVRRSTLRFSENYTFPQIPVASKKGAKQEPPPETDDRLSFNGYCARIKSSAPIDLRAQ